MSREDTRRPQEQRDVPGREEEEDSAVPAAGGDAKKDTATDPDYKRLLLRGAPSRENVPVNHGRDKILWDDSREPPPLRESSAGRYLILRGTAPGFDRRRPLPKNPAANLISLISAAAPLREDTFLGFYSTRLQTESRNFNASEPPTGWTLPWKYRLPDWDLDFFENFLSLHLFPSSTPCLKMTRRLRDVMNFKWRTRLILTFHCKLIYNTSFNSYSTIS